MPPPAKWALAAWLSLAGILYLTLLPFHFTSLSFSSAWDAYWQLSLSGPRPSDRQQWVANVLMFLPLGFFWTGWLVQYGSSAQWRVGVAAFVAVLALVTTGTVEFVQSWIPVRAPSLLDMSANFTGGVLGILGWFLLAGRIQEWLTLLRRGGTQAIQRLLLAYVVLFVLASLLPLDFVLSLQELKGRLESDLTGLWTASAGCNAGLRCGLLSAGKLLLMIPVGAWLALVLGRRAHLAWVLAPVLAIGVEIGQLMTVSGMAEGLSAAIRSAGALLGVLATQHWQALKRIPLVRLARPLVVVATVPYLLLVAGVTLGEYGVTLDTALVAERWSAVRWLPFYHHYSVAEAKAILSVMTHLLMFAPVGLAVWLWSLGSPGGPRQQHGWVALGLALLLAVLIESAKLFVAGARADVTNPLLAATGAWGCWWVFNLGWSLRHQRGAFPKPEPSGARQEAMAMAPTATAAATESTRGSAPALPRLIGLALLALTAWLAATWPAAAGWLFAGLVAYGAWLWKRPEAWLLVIPALAPNLNLSLITGRFLFDELDLLLLTTVGVLLLHWRPGRGMPPLPRGLAWAAGLFAMSVLVSLAWVMTPWPGFDANAMLHYSNAWNGLRIAKGFLWALVLFALLRQSSESPERLLHAWFVPGMVLGLVGAIAVVLWERAAYPGLTDFDSTFRVAGMFTDMHVGGPSLAAYLVMATPFVLLWMWHQRQWAWMLPVLILLAAALYATVVTYSRAGYAGMGMAALLLAAGALAGTVSLRGRDRWRLVAIALLPLLLAVVLLPQLKGNFLDQRLGQVAGDLESRWAHWQLAFGLRERGWWADAFGVGMGSFPRAYAVGNPEGRMPANFAFETGPGVPMLRLGTGDSLYINQRIDLQRRGMHTLTVDARADTSSRLSLYVCEKPVRHSFTCRTGTVEIPAQAANGGLQTWRFDASNLQSGPWFARRQLVFSFTNRTPGSVIELHRLSLASPAGTEILRNGDFSQGARHWYFTTDHLWPWRTENQWLEIWFDQGWAGLLAFLALTWLGGWALLKGALRGRFEDACILASIAGVLTVGLLGTVFWSPRISLLFYLILLLGTAAGVGRRTGPFRAHNRPAPLGHSP